MDWLSCRLEKPLITGRWLGLPSLQHDTDIVTSKGLTACRTKINVKPIHHQDDLLLGRRLHSRLNLRYLGMLGYAFINVQNEIILDV